MTEQQNAEVDELRAACMKAARDAMQRGAIDLSSLSLVFGVGVYTGALVWCDAEPSRAKLLDQLRAYKAELEALGVSHV